MDALFLEFFGLPLHPLAVHAAVVLIPLAAITAVAGVVVYRRRPVVLAVGVVASWLAAVATIFSVQSGEALGEEIGTPQPHGEWGEILGPLMVAFTIVVTMTWWFRRRHWRVASLLGTISVVVMAPASIVFTVLVGHSGATATWGGVLDEAADATPTAVSENRYSLEEVSTHDTPDDCWVVVDAVVYDVSGFGSSHPGGQAAIERICGTDATEAFRGQHGTSGSPNSTLAGFEIGRLN